MSKALNDGQISEQVFKIVLDVLDRYNDLKDQTHTKQSGLSEQEKKDVNRRRKIPSTGAIQNKDKRHIIVFSKFVFANDPPPK